VSLTVRLTSRQRQRNPAGDVSQPRRVVKSTAYTQSALADDKKRFCLVPTDNRRSRTPHRRTVSECDGSASAQRSASRPTAVPEQGGRGSVRRPAGRPRPIYRRRGRTEVLPFSGCSSSPACRPAAAEMGLRCSGSPNLIVG